MKSSLTPMMNVVCVATALVLGTACANTTGASVWKNSDYGNGTPAIATPAAAIRPTTGLAILN